MHGASRLSFVDVLVVTWRVLALQTSTSLSVKFSLDSSLCFSLSLTLEEHQLLPFNTVLCGSKPGQQPFPTTRPCFEPSRPLRNARYRRFKDKVSCQAKGERKTNDVNQEHKYFGLSTLIDGRPSELDIPRGTYHRVPMTVCDPGIHPWPRETGQSMDTIFNHVERACPVYF